MARHGPAHRARAASCTEPEQPAAADGCALAVRLLFLENHETFARTVIDAFMSDHEVVVVGTVRAALASLAGGGFDAALVDYDLDGEKGDHFVSQARASGAELPIIAVSARSEGNQALVRAGANCVCRKLDFKQLPSLLRRLAVA